MSAPFVVAANWKMNKNPKEAKEFFMTFGETYKASDDIEVLFFVPDLDLYVAEEASQKIEFGWGPENTHFEMEGAFTGETSPKLVAEFGATHGLVGHSERRTLFGETDDVLAKKLKALQDNNLTPVFCIGETLEEREQEKTLEVLERQLSKGLSQLDTSKPFHIAYEPVWAIGTGKVAEVDQVEEAHIYIRQFLDDNFGNSSKKAQILYGGSVKPGNAGELARTSEVGGFLVGGASLKPDSFCEIIEAARS